MSKKKPENINDLSLYQLAKKCENTAQDSLEGMTYSTTLAQKVYSFIKQNQDKKVEEALFRAHSSKEENIYHMLINEINVTLLNLHNTSSHLILMPYITNIKTEDSMPEPTVFELESIMREEFVSKGMLEKDEYFKVSSFIVDGNVASDMKFSNWLHLHEELYALKDSDDNNVALPIERNQALIKVNYLLITLERVNSNLLGLVLNSFEANNPLSQSIQNITDTLNEKYHHLNWLLMFPNGALLAVEAGAAARDNIILDSLFHNFAPQKNSEFICFYVKEDPSQAAVSIWNQDTGSLEVIAFIREKSLNMQLIGKMDEYGVPRVQIFKEPLSLNIDTLQSINMTQFLNMGQTVSFLGSNKAHIEKPQA